MANTKGKGLMQAMREVVGGEGDSAHKLHATREEGRD